MTPRTRTTKDSAYRTLVAEIVDGVLPPGTPLSERSLVERFGISRTPIRQVIWRLERDELVDVYVNRGVFVKKMGADEILELFQLREALEPLAAMLAATHRSEADLASLEERMRKADADPNRPTSELVRLGESLHDALVRWSGNRMLRRIYETMRMQTQLMRNLLHESNGSERTSLVEHLAILDAVRRKDPEAARTLMTDHLRRSRLAIIDGLFSPGSPLAHKPPVVAVSSPSAHEET